MTGHVRFCNSGLISRIINGEVFLIVCLFNVNTTIQLWWWQNNQTPIELSLLGQRTNLGHIGLRNWILIDWNLVNLDTNIEVCTNHFWPICKQTSAQSSSLYWELLQRTSILSSVFAAGGNMQWMVDTSNSRQSDSGEKL